jgi:hypothetical protein
MTDENRSDVRDCAQLAAIKNFVVNPPICVQQILPANPQT